MAPDVSGNFWLDIKVLAEFFAKELQTWWSGG